MLEAQGLGGHVRVGVLYLAHMAVEVEEHRQARVRLEGRPLGHALHVGVELLDELVPVGLHLVVLDEGRVVEKGSPAELLAAGGVYARMAAAARDAGERSDAPAGMSDGKGVDAL